MKAGEDLRYLMKCECLSVDCTLRINTFHIQLTAVGQGVERREKDNLGLPYSEDWQDSSVLLQSGRLLEDTKACCYVLIFLPRENAYMLSMGIAGSLSPVVC